MKRVIFTILILVALVRLSPLTYALILELPGAEAEAEGSCFGSYLHNHPPIIYSVTQDKSSPAAGEEVNITAEIANDVEVTDAITTEAWIIYSIDGGKTWERVDMKQDESNKRIWRGTIRGQKSGTKVIYYIQAIDSRGSLATESPGESPTDAWAKLKKVTTGKEKAALPDAGILFTYPVDDEDCSEAECPAGSDILKFSFAYSEEDVMAKIQVQADKVDIGTLSPVRIVAIALGVLNIDLGDDVTKGKALLFTPLGSYILTSGAFIPRDTIPIDVKVIESKMIPSQVEVGDDSIVKGNTLYLKFYRRWLGPHPSGELKVIGIAGVVLPIDGKARTNPGLAPYDATPFIRVYMRNYTYTVK